MESELSGIFRVKLVTKNIVRGSPGTQFMHMRVKYSSYTNHLQFSLRCHHNKILLKDLQLKSRIKTERSKITLQCTGKLLLQDRIHINHVRRDRLKNSSEQLKGKVLESVRPDEFHLVEKIHEDSYKKSFELPKRDIYQNLMN